MQTTTMTPDTIPATSTLPDGDALGNDILATAGQTATAKLLRATASGGRSAKAGAAKSGAAPRVMFQPRGWTMGGRVD